MGDKQKCAAELDKLKRRMIRTVARLLKEKKTEEQLWEELKKESGANCKKLWERMRSLTMKKLKRLLDVDDRVELVPAVARMNLTDWLLYDLVIVHEKVDVIDRGNPMKGESKVLSNLFSLVQMFSIEGRAGDDLAEAWTAATVHYNSKGHQCSPMLMQRRWYQIKELTRHKMYKFWFNYRGNQRLLSTAKQDPPTELQKAIALRYPGIITQPFPAWGERIEQKLVIMPEEFEIKMRKKTLMKPSDESAPDVVIVEQQVDTITLGDSDSDFSDGENSRESNASSLKPEININNKEMQKPIIVQVKTEPQDDIDVSETIYQPPSEQANNRLLDEIDRLAMVEDKIVTENNIGDASTGQNEIEEGMMPLITSVTGAVDTVNEDTVPNNAPTDDKELEIEVNTDTRESILIDDDDDVPFNDVQLEKNAVVSNETNGIDQTEKLNKSEVTNQAGAINQTNLINHSEVINPIEVVNQTEVIIQAEIYNQAEVVNQPDEYNQTENVIDITSPEPKRITKWEPVEPIIDMLEIEESTVMAEAISSIACDSAVTKDIDTEIQNEYSVGKVEAIIPPVTSTEDIQIPEKNVAWKDNETHEFDHGDDVISEMNFADDGIEFADEGIEYIEDDDDLDETPVAQETSNSVRDVDGTPKFDLKLLMNPVVYTTKLDEMSVYKDIPLYDTIDTRELVDKISDESKPVSANSINAEPEKKENIVVKVENQDTDNTNDTDDDLFHNETEEESDFITETKKVKLSSNLLQKPKSRSYNPIQLCKNPDFNTRLKRLTVGFFSSTRNRVLLKACKPMTIDLSKAFESKLVEGTMYLKPSDQTIKIKEVEDDIESTTVLPSAVPVQSLMDTTDVDKILQVELKKRMIERNKPITLPHISVVRQINQNLLMAEVAPIMALIDKSANGNDASSQNDTIVDKQNETIVDKQNDAIVKENDTIVKQNDTMVDNQNSSLSHARIHQANTDTNITKENPTVSNNPLLHNLLQDKQPVNLQINNSSNEASNNYTLEKPKPNETLQPSKLEKLLEKRKKILERQKTMNLPSWITKSTNTYPNKATDSLLTIDTLYKMLNALDPCKEYASKFNKISKKTAKISTIKKMYTDSMTKKQEPKDVIVIDADTVETTHSTANITKVVNKLPAKHRRKNCCWAKSKILKMTGATPNARLSGHRCGQNCKCCCKEELRRAALDIEVKILQESRDRADNVQTVIDCVVLQSLDQSSNDSPVNVVNVDTNMTQLEPSATTAVVGLKIGIDQSDAVDIVHHSAENKLETNTEPILQLEEAEVIIDLDSEDANPTISSNEASLPTPRIRVYSGDDLNNKITVPVKSTKPVSQRTRKRYVCPTETKRTIIQPTMTPLYPKAAPKILPRNKTMSPKILSSNELEDIELPCSCQHVAVEKSAAMLRINSSNDCLRHSKSRISKETRIYINRKHMSETERPFYVGRNKILLTNVKQPAPPSSSPPPAPVELTLPEGVQVVLLPDGTISYLVDPNIELTPDQIAAMPLILTAVQEQIKAAGITLPTAFNSDLEANNQAINVKNDDNSKSVEITDDGQNRDNSSNIDENNQENNNTNEKLTTSSSDSIKADTKDLQNQVDQHSQLVEITDDGLNRDHSSNNDKSDQENNYTNEKITTSASDTIQKDATDLQNQVDENSQSVDITENDQNSVNSSNIDENNQQNCNTSEKITTSASDSIHTDTIDSQNRVNSESENKTELATKTPPDLMKKPNENLNTKARTTSSQSDLAESSVPEVEFVSEVMNNTNSKNEVAEIEKNTNDASKVPDVATDTSDEKTCCLPVNIALSSKEAAAMDTSDTSSGAAEIADNEHNYAESPEKNKVSSESVDETNNAAKTSRNLLSDLMEMSGIVEEDIASAPQEATAGQNDSPGSLMQPLSLPIPQESSTDLTVPAFSPIGSRHTISAQIDEQVHELNPITSFAELKYACDHDGLFFKLDLNTGLIVPINVCIQKSTPESGPSKPMMNPTEVIDLTDEQGVSLDQQSFSMTQRTTDSETQCDFEISNVNTVKKIVPRKLSTMMPDQPKLVQIPDKQPVQISSDESNPNRRMGRLTKRSNQLKLVQILPDLSKPPRILQDLPDEPNPIRGRGRPPKKSVLKIHEPLSPADMDIRKQQLLSRLSNNLKPLKMLRNPCINILKKNPSLSTSNIILQHRRKSKLEARIDLVDSDAPMEEEYLVEDSSDDSDDEPLAKIAKKMHSGNDHPPAKEILNKELCQSSSASRDDTVPLLNDIHINDVKINDDNINEDNMNEDNMNEDNMNEDNMNEDNINKDNMDDDNIDFEKAIDALPIARPLPANNEVEEPVPTQLVLSGPTLNQPILLNDAFLIGNESEDSQDDCILGV